MSDKPLPAASSDAPGHPPALSRRRFLGTAGVGAMALGPAGTAAGRAAAGSALPHPTFFLTERFTRIFPDLAPFAPPSDDLNRALVELSRPGGFLDANDPLEIGPQRLITEPALSPNNRDNPTQTAGTTFVGQFLDHDITRDGGSALGRPTDVARSRNLRNPRLDLDSVYGGGPLLSPELYRRSPIRFIVESGGQFEDVPRRKDGSAVIAEPRNDENLIVNGLHAAFLLFHNAVADRMEAGRRRRHVAFDDVRRAVTWHWQWIVWNEYLPQIVGRSVLDDLTAVGARFFKPARPAIPVEFQGAAFRFGHSQVRPSYRANLAGDGGKPFFALVFDLADVASADPNSLVGGKRSPRRFIGWQTFFDFGDGQVKPNKRIDTRISSPLFRLPSGVIDLPSGGDVGPTSLATRNLLRHVTWGMPSGQAVAQRIGAPVLAAADLADFGSFGHDLDRSTPLWLYVLREADVIEDGLRLGPVGARIVAEVIHVLLKSDRGSYLRANPRWTPDLPSAHGPGDFRMADLLTVAGVDPVSRGQ